MDIPGEGTQVAADGDGHLQEELVQTREALVESERRYRLLAANATDMVIRATVLGTITYVSPSVGAVLGYDARELLDTSVIDLVHPDDRLRTLERMADGLDGRTEPNRFVCRSKGANGSWIWTETLSRPIVDPDTGVITEFQSSIRDVTEQVEAEQRLRQSEQRFRSAVACSPAATAIVDRRHRALVVNRAMCRLIGAEEETLLGADWRTWVDLADQLLLAQTANAGWGGRVTRPLDLRFRGPSGSVRWGRLTLSALDPDDEPGGRGELDGLDGSGWLVQIQDVTTERRRVELMDRHNLDEGLGGRLRRHEVDNLIETALDAGWLRLHYQPIVDLRTRRVVGHEALLRIHHPTRGVLLPAAFLGRAEETDLIFPIGRWVVAEAIRRTGERWARGERTWVGVNVAGPQLVHDDLAGMVVQALEEANLPSTAVHIEITESTQLLPEGAGPAEVGRIRALGCPIWLDDFGTGFSSLTYVRQLPVSGLKLDRTFVAGVGTEVEASAIVASVVALAKGLGLELVAEGVETEQQAITLARMGCPTAQGFLFGRAEEGPDA